MDPAPRCLAFSSNDGVEPIDLSTLGVLSMARRIAPEIANRRFLSLCPLDRL
jgi:hypothetical protein